MKCSRCDEEVEWEGMGDENLCQIHFEEMCSDEWWRLIFLGELV